MMCKNNKYFSVGTLRNSFYAMMITDNYCHCPKTVHNPKVQVMPFH